MKPNFRVVALVAMSWSPLALAGDGFLGFDGGIAIQSNAGIKDSGGDKIGFENGLRLDFVAGFGTRAPNTVAMELELGLIYNSSKPIATLDSERLDLYEVPMLMNVVYTLPLSGPVRAYAGAGIGGVYGIFVGPGTGFFGYNTDITFGYQGTVGVDWMISERWRLGIAYKFLGTTDWDMGAFKSDGTMTHSFLAKATLQF